MPQPDDPGCFATTFERKYYRRDNVFIKRSLRPEEYRTGYKGLYVPRSGIERLKNEADCMRFVRQNTNVPVPTLLCDFEDAGAYYLIMEYIEGVGMNELADQEKHTVKAELRQHLSILHALKSDRLGGPGGLVLPPYRITLQTDKDNWHPRRAKDEEFVFCHNDLSQHNVVVDPQTLQIRAILDWEYAGFYPAWFEAPLYERLGPSIAVKGEIDDSQKLLQYMLACEADPI